MIIIWGTHSYFRSNKSVQYGFCSSCNRFAKFRSWNGRTFFHLYYIPLIPVEQRKRNHSCCNRCQVIQEFPLDVFDSATLRYKEQAAFAILALQSEESVFFLDEYPDQALDALMFLEGALEWLHAANEHEFVQDILDQLKLPGCQYAELMLQAYLSVLMGQLDQAISHYQNAATLAPNQYLPKYRAGMFLLERGKSDEAIEAFQSALPLADDPAFGLALGLKLVELLMARKRFAEADPLYDQLLASHPELAEDRGFLKQAAKAKKKGAPEKPFGSQ